MPKPPHHEWTPEDRGDPTCFQFEPRRVSAVYALLGRQAAPELTPVACPQHWRTLPFVDCTDAALAFYRARRNREP